MGSGRQGGTIGTGLGSSISSACVVQCATSHFTTGENAIISQVVITFAIGTWGSGSWTRLGSKSRLGGERDVGVGVGRLTEFFSGADEGVFLKDAL
jgi:hypothetical protein